MLIMTNDPNKKRKILALSGVFLLLLGIAALTIITLFGDHSDAGMIEGFYSGTGAGLVMAGLFYIIYFGLILRNPEKRKKFEIDEKDERNQFIKMKTGYAGFFISMGIQYIALLAAGLISRDAFLVLVIAFLAQFLLVSIAYFINKRMY